MDYLRSCYTAPARLIAGSDDTFPITWYRAAPGAAVYLEPHAFGSTVWDDDDFPANEGIGEIPNVRTWSPTINKGAFPGTCEPQSADYLLHGVPQSVVDQGYPHTWCCFPFPYEVDLSVSACGCGSVLWH